MKIDIFGLGYVGCVSLACFAKLGHQVIGVDINDRKVEFINTGRPTIIEDDVETILSDQHKLGHISATADSHYAVRRSEVTFICVGTPPTDNGHLNLDAVFNVSEEIGQALAHKNSFHTVVIRSTVLPGTNAKVARIIEKASGKKEGADFGVVSNPEFLREGTAVSDFFCPPFSLIGATNPKAIDVLKNLYSKIDAPIFVVDPKTAELIKYINNAFHALKVTFANEIGNICKKLEIDSHKVMEIFVQDKKLNLSPYYLKPGFAYGGSCLPKDLSALNNIAHDQYLECRLLASIEKSNEFQKEYVLKQILQFDKKRIGFLGISFKAGTDDLRNSPIVDIIERLLGKGFEVKIYDRSVHISKLVGANREYILKKIPYISTFITEDPNGVIFESDVVVIVNYEKELETLLSQTPVDTIIYDLVNINFKTREARKNYIGIAW